jgi:hypothetical protein
VAERHDGIAARRDSLALNVGSVDDDAAGDLGRRHGAIGDAFNGA